MNIKEKRLESKIKPVSRRPWRTALLGVYAEEDVKTMPYYRILVKIDSFDKPISFLAKKIEYPAQLPFISFSEIMKEPADQIYIQGQHFLRLQDVLMDSKKLMIGWGQIILIQEIKDNKVFKVVPRD